MKWIVYLVVPSLLSGTLIAGYFFGPSWLQQAVSPSLNRELGLLENVQNVLLLVMIVFLVGGLWRKKLKIEQIVLACLFLFAVLVLMEELDYGQHHWRFLRGERITNPRYPNLHNRGDLTRIIKCVLDLGLGIFFVVIPLCFAKSRKPFLRYLSPDRFSIWTIVVMAVLSKVAHGLNKVITDTPGSINKNISEFREVLVYYIFAVYLFEVIFRRTYGETQNEGG